MVEGTMPLSVLSLTMGRREEFVAPHSASCLGFCRWFRALLRFTAAVDCAALLRFAAAADVSRVGGRVGLVCRLSPDDNAYLSTKSCFDSDVSFLTVTPPW